MTKTCYINVKDEVWCSIAGITPSEQDFFYNLLAPYAEGYFFSPKYKLGVWDGKIRFYQKSGKTYIRLLDRILPHLEKWGYDIELIDNRKAQPVPEVAGELTVFDSDGIAIEGRGLDVLGDVEVRPGKRFELRPYQLQAVRRAVESGCGFIIAGTGAGKCLHGSSLIALRASSKLSKAIDYVSNRDRSELLPKELDALLELESRVVDRPRPDGTIICTIAELFSAITVVEQHYFTEEIEYLQQEEIYIEAPGGWTRIRGLITKFSQTVSLQTSVGNLRCARRHILFRVDGMEVWAEDVAPGDQLAGIDGPITVYDVEFCGGELVYDVEVDRDDHIYATANGILHHNTSITAGISHFYGLAGHKVITIVPSGDLVSQTKEWYELIGLDVGEYSGECKDIDHTHVVATWQALQYNPTVMQEFSALIWDECHGLKAAVAAKLINEHGSHIAFRFGVTGTFPKHEVDQLSLTASIGSILIEIPAAWLIKNDYLSQVEIHPVELHETYIDENFPDYSSEKAFLSKSPARLEAIADVIVSQAASYGNTLVLVNSIKFGERLSSLIKDSVFLYGQSPKDIRKEHYEMFEERNDLIVIASSGIASTGISIDRIFCLVLVDAGKSFIKSIQSIGRGLRRGEDKSSVAVFDVHSKLKWAQKHFKERQKHYKEASYPIAKKHTLKIKG